jgi:ribosomal-protein-alanine acetyltransferase
VSEGGVSEDAGLAGPGGSGREVVADGSSRNSETPPSLTLRAAAESDLDSIWAIESSVFGAEAWSRDMMCEELTAEHRCYLALIDAEGVILGYGGLLAVGEEGDIQTIAIAPGARGSGQGRRLMNALLDAGSARGVREVFLEVRADNTVARALYASLGFEEIGVRPRYYQPEGVDAIVNKLQMENRR